MAAGAASNQLRSAFVVETTPGTTPATPSFKTLHQGILFDDDTQRMSQPSLIARGANFGDALLYRKAAGKISNANIVYLVYDTWLESLLQSSFVANVMSDGTSVQAHTVENTIPAGVGGTSIMKRYTGVEAIGAKISADALGKVQFDMDFLGMSSVAATNTAIAGATYTDPANKDPFSATTDIGAITIAGFTLDDLVSMEMDLSYGDRDGQPKLGTDTLAGIARGAFRPMLKFKFYIQSNFQALYDAARVQTQTTAKVTVNMGSVTLKKYKWEFWDCNINTSALELGGSSGFLNVTVEPKYSPANSCILTLTRAVA